MYTQVCVFETSFSKREENNLMKITNFVKKLKMWVCNAIPFCRWLKRSSIQITCLPAKVIEIRYSPPVNFTYIHFAIEFYKSSVRSLKKACLLKVSRSRYKIVDFSQKTNETQSGQYPECVLFVFWEKLRLDNFVSRLTDLQQCFSTYKGA